MQQAVTVEDEMRTKIIQSVEIEPGRWGTFYNYFIFHFA